jgi:hypothetical protein
VLLIEQQLERFGLPDHVRHAQLGGQCGALTLERALLGLPVALQRRARLAPLSLLLLQARERLARLAHRQLGGPQALAQLIALQGIVADLAADLLDLLPDRLEFGLGLAH